MGPGKAPAQILLSNTEKTKPIPETFMVVSRLVANRLRDGNAVGMGGQGRRASGWASWGQKPTNACLSQAPREYGAAHDAHGGAPAVLVQGGNTQSNFR